MVADRALGTNMGLETWFTSRTRTFPDTMRGVLYLPLGDEPVGFHMVTAVSVRKEDELELIK